MKVTMVSTTDTHHCQLCVQRSAIVIAVVDGLPWTGTYMCDMCSKDGAWLTDDVETRRISL